MNAREGARRGVKGAETGERDEGRVPCLLGAETWEWSFFNSRFTDAS
jgi:hypothetical protein